MPDIQIESITLPITRGEQTEPVKYKFPIVDPDLTTQGAAADAKKVGDELTDLKEDISQMNTATASDVGKALLAKTVADGKVTEWEFGEAGGDGGIYGENLYFAGSTNNGTDYFNNTDMSIVCKVPANMHVTKIEVRGNSSANGEIPIVHVLEHNTNDDTYTIIYAKELSALVAKTYTSTDVDFQFENETYLAIGGCKNIINTLANNYALSYLRSYYSSGNVGDTVTINTLSSYKMYYGVNVYYIGNDLTKETVDEVATYDYIKQAIEIPYDETVYSTTKSSTSTEYWSDRIIYAGEKITKIRFKASEAGTALISFADFSFQPTIHRWLIVKTISVEAVAGWNEFDVNLVFDRDVYLGIGGIVFPAFTYQQAANSVTYGNYKFMQSVAYSSYISNVSEGAWVAGQATDVAFYFAIPVTWFTESGQLFDIKSDVDKLNENVKLIPNNADLRTAPVLPEYTILKDEEIGYVGKWYTTEINGVTAHVCNAAGGEFYFRTKGTASVTIEFGMPSEYLSTSYYAYSIDNGAFTRVSADSPIITLPDDNWHIVRVVCDSTGTGMAVWTVGGGFVVYGVDAGNGSLNGLLPEKTPRVVHLGDSIAVGCRAFGQEVSGESVESDVTSVTHSYAWYCSQALNAISYMDSYGGTGVISNGSTANCPTMIEYAAPNILAEPIEADLVVLEHGHNDSTASAANFETAYKALLQKIRCAYPGAPIVCVIPFNNQKKSVIEAVVPTEQNCYLVDVYKDVYPPTYYADGPGHLLDAGAEVIGNVIAKRIREMHLL